jgi:hypothetical protein
VEISQQQMILNPVSQNGDAKKNHINYDEIKKLLMKDPKSHPKQKAYNNGIQI